MNIRFIKLLVIVVALSIYVPMANADEDPLPGIANGAYIGPRQDVSSSTGEPLDGSPIITCPAGAGLAAVAGDGNNYVRCFKNWVPQSVIDAQAAFRELLRNAQNAAEADSLAWNTDHPGQQKCFQWGPYTDANGGTSSGGVCANPVGNLPSNPASTFMETSTSPAETSTAQSPAPPPSSPVNTNGFGGYAVVHPDGHVCGVIVANSNDPFNNGGVMPQEYMGCPAGSRIVFQTAPSAEGNVAGWHGENVIENHGQFQIGGSDTITISSGIATDTSGKSWNTGTGQVLAGETTTTKSQIDTTTVTSDVETQTSLTRLAPQNQNILPETPTAVIVPISQNIENLTALSVLKSLTAKDKENLLSVTVKANKSSIINVAADLPGVNLLVTATKKGEKSIVISVRTNTNGDAQIKTSRNLSGFTVVLSLGKTKLDTDVVKK